MSRKAARPGSGVGEVPVRDAWAKQPPRAVSKENGLYVGKRVGERGCPEGSATQH